MVPCSSSSCSSSTVLIFVCPWARVSERGSTVSSIDFLVPLEIIYQLRRAITLYTEILSLGPQYTLKLFLENLQKTRVFLMVTTKKCRANFPSPSFNLWQGCYSTLEITCPGPFTFKSVLPDLKAPFLSSKSFTTFPSSTFLLLLSSWFESDSFPGRR